MRPSSKGNNTKLSDFLKCQVWGRIDLKTAYQKPGVCRIHHRRKQNRKKKLIKQWTGKEERVWFNIFY